MTKSNLPIGHFNDRELEVYQRAIDDAAAIARENGDEIIASLIEEKGEVAEIEVIKSRNRQKQAQQKRWAEN